MYFVLNTSMSNKTKNIRVASETYHKLAKLGTLEDSFDSVIEGLLRINYEQERRQQQGRMQEQALESRKMQT
jgi:predicted CopG family antitoxin